MGVAQEEKYGQKAGPKLGVLLGKTEAFILL